MKKLLIFIFVFFITSSVNAKYEEIECSTDSIFSENSCTKCYNGWKKSQWDTLWLLDSTWNNNTDFSKILYKEEQIDPEIINLNNSNVSWIKTSEDENFWKYTDEFNALYDDEKWGYVLNKNNSVIWLKTPILNTYKLEKNTSASDSNIWLLIYPLTIHNILPDDEITFDNDEARDCVLYKSAGIIESTSIKKETKKLPDTGPSQFILLLILAIILSFSILKLKKIV